MYKNAEFNLTQKSEVRAGNDVIPELTVFQYKTSEKQEMGFALARLDITNTNSSKVRNCKSLSAIP